MTYDELKAILGSANAPGRLQELQGILNAVPPATIGLTRTGLLTCFEVACKIQEEHAGIFAKLEELSNQVSFRRASMLMCSDLYDQ